MAKANNFIDMTGWDMKKHGIPKSKLSVIRQAKTDKKGVYWECLCECGRTTVVKGSHLRDGKIKSCGKCGSKRVDMAGWKMKEHGVEDSLITVLEYTETKKQGKKNTTIWKCQCECGNIFYASASHIRSGHTKRCGRCQPHNDNWKIVKDLGGQGESHKYLCECSCENHTQQVLTRSQLQSNTPRYCDYCRPPLWKDLSNQRFGKITALYPTEKRKGTNVVWKVRCDCGEEFECSSHELSSHIKYACPKCSNSISKGEQKIKEILDNNHIVYEREKTFDSCRSKTNTKLRFDFYLPDYNLVCEYDGKQHSKKEELVFGRYKFEDLQANDRIKDNWCKENKVKIVRIPYTKYKEIDLDLILGVKN